MRVEKRRHREEEEEETLFDNGMVIRYRDMQT